MTDILESRIEGGLLDRHVAVGHQIAGLLQPGLYQILLGRAVEETPVILIKLAFADV